MTVCRHKGKVIKRGSSCACLCVSLLTNLIDQLVRAIYCGISNEDLDYNTVYIL